jgi:hypothetical protein
MCVFRVSGRDFTLQPKDYLLGGMLGFSMLGGSNAHSDRINALLGANKVFDASFLIDVAYTPSFFFPSLSPSFFFSLFQEEFDLFILGDTFLKT